ncbi:MAG: tRNA pseudouridine(38-40) synthase TruA [Flavobacterium sp.]|nr:tRNA pseudouridine(38-40) synthase TruA [Flavobacterium sp.]
MRYFLEIAYNGTRYHGWQRQPNAITVQETAEKALSTILGSQIVTTGAGRTDTGVHARQLYAHFDFEGFFECAKLVYKLNSFLPPDISVISIIPVSDNAHARFDAVSRTYEYHITTVKNPFATELSWHYHNPIDVLQMNLAAQRLLGKHDFECFCKSNSDVNSFDCQVTNAHWQQSGNQYIFTITADRFLRNMVRAIVGTLIDVGSAKITISDFERILQSKSRSEAGFSVPAHGLFLTQIMYPYINQDIR